MAEAHQKTSIAQTSFLKRYGAVLFAIVLFLILNIGVLTSNFYIAIQLSEDALDINLSGRQRMLSQRITKTLLQIEVAVANNQSTASAVKELNLAYDLFDSTIKAFDTGGFTTGADGQQSTLAAVSDPDARAAVEAGKSIWIPFSELLRPVLLSSGTIDFDALNKAAAYATANNLALLKEMNNLTVALEQEASARTEFLRLIQTIALIVLILDYAFIVYDFLTKIRRSDKEIEDKAADLENAVDNLQSTTNELESAQRETDTILNTVRQGLLLVDPEYKISGKYSEELKSMFRLDDLSGMGFLAIMQRILTEKNYLTTRDYMDMLFDPKKKEKTLLKINPLEEAEVHFQERNGQFTTRFYEFQFKRILDDKKVVSVFISVRDVTAQVELTRQLKEAEENKEAQFELLLAILNVPATEVISFCKKSLESIEQANEILKVEDFVGEKEIHNAESDLRDKLNTIFRHIHSIKGHASLQNIDYFVEITHNIEDQISRIRSKPKLAGEDFLGIVSLISDCKSAVTECQQLAEKVHGLAPTSLAPSPAENGATKIASFSEQDLAQFRQLISQLSEQTGKKAKLVVNLSPDIKLNDKQRDVIKEATTQFIRNSFAHGIETGEKRAAAGKDPTAALTIRLKTNGDGLHFEYEDDGAGFDHEAIRRKAIEKNLVSEQEALSKEDYEWWFYLFEPDFSTRDQADTIGGRGVGLDIVRNSVMTELNGQILLNSEPGVFSSFQFNIPSTTGNA
ncbi:MAG: ATP-binding protein [Verrucomicrobiota bacterium]